MSKSKRAKSTSDGFQAPTERWQHGSTATTIRDPASNARVQRVDSAVSQLVHSGTLQARHQAAADRWTADYQFGVHGARDPEKRGGGGQGYDALTIARLESCNRYLDAKAAVGRYADELLVAVLHDRLSLTAIAAQRGSQTSRVSGMLVGAMERLVEHYEAADSPRRRRHTIAGSTAHQPPAVALAA